MKKHRRFEENKEVREASDRLMSATANRQRGEMITHGEIAAISGFAKHTGRWHHVVKKLQKRMLAERGIELVNVQGEGYTLAEPSTQIIDRPQWRVKRATRQLRRGAQSLSAIPDAHLSDRQQFIRNKMLDANRAAAREMKARAKLDKALLASRPKKHVVIEQEAATV